MMHSAAAGFPAEICKHKAKGAVKLNRHDAGCITDEVM